MVKREKHNTIKLVISGIVTAAGVALVGAKMYSHIGLILMSFGSVMLGLALEARKKEVTSDELTEWVSGKAAVASFWATWSSIVLLLAVDLYKPNFIETYIALGIVMMAACGALFLGMHYYGKVNKRIAF